MIEIKLDNKVFQLSKRQLKELYYDISAKNREVPRHLEKIGDTIAQYDNLKFLLFKKYIALKLFDITLTINNKFGICFALVSTDYEIRKFNPSKEIKQSLNLQTIFSKIKNSNKYEKFLSLFKKYNKIYHNDPQFLLFIYYFSKDLALFIKEKSFFKKKYDNSLVFILKEFKFKLNDALYLTSNESGYDFFKITKELLFSGANPNKAIINAIQISNLESVVFLLNNGVNINLTDKNKSSLLTLAVEKGNAILSDIILKAGVNINHQDIDGETALMKACKRGDLIITYLLIKSKAKINIEDNLGNTAFVFAVTKSFPSIIKILLKNGVNYHLMKSLLTPHHKIERRIFIKVLINSCKCDIEQYHHMVKKQIKNAGLLSKYKNEFKYAVQELSEDKNFQGFTTPKDEKKELKESKTVDELIEDLVEAVIFGNSSKVQSLLSQGAKTTVRNKYNLGHTDFIHLSVWHNDITTTGLLLEYGTDVNLKNTSGNTPIFLAITKKNKNMFLLLREHKADINLVNNFGNSAYDLLKQNNLLLWLK